MTEALTEDRTFQALFPLLVRRARPIAFVGMMGAGKSTLARQLGVVLGLSAYDTDFEIEKQLGMSIAECFSKQGEAVFRACESQVIEEHLHRGANILSLGGGAFINPVLREKLLKYADCVYLDVPPNRLWERVKNRLSKRPLLEGKNPRGNFDTLYTKRASIYALAPIHLSWQDEDIATTTLRVKEALWDYIGTQT